MKRNIISIDLQRQAVHIGARRSILTRQLVLVYQPKRVKTLLELFEQQYYCSQCSTTISERSTALRRHLFDSYHPYCIGDTIREKRTMRKAGMAGGGKGGAKSTAARSNEVLIESGIATLDRATATDRQGQLEGKQRRTTNH